jgi:HSP20 family protein
MKSEEEQIVREEMLTGEFERQFTLPDSVNTDSINANYKDGILTIELDKKDEVKAREIDIKIK